MKLISLLDGFGLELGQAAQLEILDIQSDSRAVDAGTLFIALNGATVDGHNYIESAVSKGAVAVLVEDIDKVPESVSVPVFHAPFIRQKLSVIASRFFEEPSSDLFVVGITGTNGKTSTTYYLKNIFETMGCATGLIGTIHYVIGDQVEDAPNTTPDALSLQRLLARMRDVGLKAVVMEVSSHALTLRRVGGIDFDVAVFTNITEDHLDFHENMENYLEAKLSFLAYLQRSRKANKMVCYNRNIEYKEQVEAAIDASGLPACSFGVDVDSDFNASNAVASLDETSFELASPAGNGRIELAARGYFTIYNSLAACCAASCYGAKFDDFVNGLREVVIPGRFEIVPNTAGFLVVVDYAHTDDALKNLISSARKLEPKRVITVFGCGGDRDRKKRAIMGRVASELSDIVIVTSDNPRSEDPEAIIADILEGMQQSLTPRLIFVDRAAAIAQAVKEAQPGDVVLIAGKGHEDYQIFPDRTIHFSDREEAAKVLGQL